MNQTLDEMLKRIGNAIRKIRVRDLLLALLGIFLVLFTISAVSSSKKKVTELTAAGDSLLGQEIVPLIYASEELRALKYEEAWLGSWTEAARSNRFTLEISLPDSLLAVNFGGTNLYTIKPEVIRPDRWFGNLSPEAKTGLMSKPAILTHQWSTVEKEPIVVKQAPRDTLEASAPQTVPDTTIVRPVMILFSFDNHVTLALLQSDHDTRGYYRARSALMLRAGWLRTKANLKGMFDKKEREYHPLITMEIPARNAETLYRALPDSALVVLKINQ